MYKVTLILGGKDKYEAEAETIEEAIGKLGYPPSALSGSMTIEQDGITFNRIMYPRLLRKLSVNKIFREIVAKRARVMIESQRNAA